MAIAAGTVDGVGFPALLTTVERTAASFSAAVTDGLHRFSMLKGNGLTIVLQIVGSDGAEDLVDLVHVTGSPSPG